MFFGGYPFSRGAKKPVSLTAADAPMYFAIAPELDDLKIVIGTSKLMEEDSSVVRCISSWSDKCEREVSSRLSYGDAGSTCANRVMHVAFLGNAAVGWCSSTTSGWGGDGHWGAVSVDPSVQGKGIASALAYVAEKRLLEAGCRSVQIEYRFSIGSEDKERLYTWYEEKLGFDGGPRRSGFRCCHKMLSHETIKQQHSNAIARHRACRTTEDPATPHEEGKKRTRTVSTSDASSDYTSDAASESSASPSASLSALPQLLPFDPSPNSVQAL